jgi:hypothetical protein
MVSLHLHSSPTCFQVDETHTHCYNRLQVAESSRLPRGPQNTYILELSRITFTEDTTGNLLKTPDIF